MKARAAISLVVVQLVARWGIAAGGVIRDVALGLGAGIGVAYATVFFVEAAGLVVSVWLLRRVDVAGFAASASQRPTPALEALAAAE